MYLYCDHAWSLGQIWLFTFDPPIIPHGEATASIWLSAISMASNPLLSSSPS
jgi:hypothetical protein